MHHFYLDLLENSSQERPRGENAQRLPLAQVRVGGFHLQVCLADAFFFFFKSL